jgi:predicted transcriptional regulator
MKLKEHLVEFALCAQLNKLNHKKTDFKSIKEAIFFQLKQSNKSSHELSEAIKLPKQSLLQVLSLLVIEELIMRTPENTYKIR